jgi:hypothetical protein
MPKFMFNFIAKSINAFKKISIHIIIRILIISMMIYHMIDMALKYGEYNTVIKSEFKYYEAGDLPSFTLCP